MKTTILILCLCLVSFKLPDTKVTAYDIITERISETKSGNVDRKANAVMSASSNYDVCPFVLERLIHTESSWRQWAYNDITGARGLGQVLPYYWETALYKIDSGKLGKYILRNNITNTARYYHRIGYGVELSAYVLRYFLDVHNGDYIDAVISYGGFRIEGADRDSRRRYVSNIIYRGL